MYVKTGFNLGIPINTFLSSVGTVNPALGFSGQVATGGAELTPDDLYVQGTDKFQRGNYQGAITDLNQSIDLNPQNAFAYNSRGNAYFELRQYEDAIAQYDRAIALNPNYAEAYFNRGLAHQLMGNDAQAKQDQLQSKQLLGGQVESLENKADRIQQLLDQKLRPFEFPK